MERPRSLLILLTVGTCFGVVPAVLAQIADYGAAQLARQAVVIRTPYLAQMAQITYLQKGEKSSSGSSASWLKVVLSIRIWKSECCFGMTSQASAWAIKAGWLVYNLHCRQRMNHYLPASLSDEAQEDVRFTTH